MNAAAVIYIDDAVTDDDLHFLETYTPEFLAGELTRSGTIRSVYFSIPVSYQGKLRGMPNSLTREGCDDVAFWKSVFAASGAGHLVKVCGDAPFLDASVIDEMLTLHTEYLAECTYSENLPAGFGAEIISKELIASIPEFQEKTLPLMKVVRAHINRFDIELFYKEPDLRDKRLSFRSSSPRDLRIMENLRTIAGRVPRYSELKTLIEENPDVLYIGPSYLEIELTGRAHHTCIFSYREAMRAEHGHMDLPLFKKIVDETAGFGLPFTVCLGGSGDPLLHPQFYEALEYASSLPLVERIVVETDGLEAGPNYRSFLQRDAAKKIITIVTCNGMNAETYRAIHGVDAFAAVRDNIIACSENARENSLYLQVLKINETEPFLDAYYDFWEQHKIPIILQKQNTCLGRVADRRYSDLSPLERTPCWHLQRDLYILADGTVAFCKQDIDGDCARGRLDAEPVASLWEKGRPAFRNDYRKSYPTAPDCARCDEWYTFNF